MIATAYIDTDYYYGEYGGSEEYAVDEALLERASEAVDMLCGMRITDFDDLSEDAKRHVRLAAAAEAEYIAKNGGISDAGFSPVQMSLGRFSYRTSYSRTDEKKNDAPEAVLYHLEAAGLLYRGVGTLF